MRSDAMPGTPSFREGGKGVVIRGSSLQGSRQRHGPEVSLDLRLLNGNGWLQQPAGLVMSQLPLRDSARPINDECPGRVSHGHRVEA